MRGTTSSMLNEPKSAKNHGNNDIRDAFFAYMGSAARTSPTAALSFSINGTRYKESGAVAGPHKVGFEWADIEFDAMSGLKAELVVDLPCSPLVGVAAETDVTARDADVLKIALMKSSDVPRVDFGWVAVLVGQFTIDDTR